MRYVLMVALILVAATAGWCAALPDDAALDKKVTLAVKGEALDDIMGMLSEQTGVRLQADRKIADQKATIFVDDKPLREVMEGLSKVFGYYWASKKYSTGTIYEIWQDEKSRLKLSEERQSAQDGAWKAALQDIEFKARVGAMSPEEREKLKAELSTGSAKDTAQTKSSLEAISQVEKNPLLGPCAGMLAAIPRNYLSMAKLGVSIRYDIRSTEPEWSIPENVSKLMVELLNSSPSSAMIGTVPGSTVDPATVTVDANSLSVNFSIREHQRMLQVTATVSAAATNGAVVMPRIRAVPMSQQAIGAYVAPSSLPDGDTAELSKKAGITVDDIGKEIEGYPQGDRGMVLNRSDVLALLHRKLGLQVISDHYSHWTTWPITEDSSALDILESLHPSDPGRAILAAEADWGWDGVFVYVRTRDILSADATEVPNRLLRHWASVYREKGSLSLDEYADIATLSPDQIMNLSMFGLYMGIGAQLPPMAVAPLRLYGTLAAGQRKEALAGGTDVDAFTPEQKTALTKVFFRSGNSFFFTTAPTTNAQVGIWTTETPTSRIDKPGTAPEMAQIPEPPVTVAVREGRPNPGANAPTMMPPVASIGTGNVAMRSGPTPGGVTRSFSSSDGVPYTMSFTFADGRKQEYAFSIPGKPAPKPVSENSQ